MGVAMLAGRETFPNVSCPSRKAPCNQRRQNNPMKTASKACLIALGVPFAISLLIYIPIWIDDSAARKNRAHVSTLIRIGQNLDEAERILKDARFRLLHDKPIAPTINKDYLHQIVIIGNPKPNIFETIAYSTELPWMPFIHSESPYLVIDATLAGTITGIK